MCSPLGHWLESPLSGNLTDCKSNFFSRNLASLFSLHEIPGSSLVSWGLLFQYSDGQRVGRVVRVEHLHPCQAITLSYSEDVLSLHLLVFPLSFMVVWMRDTAVSSDRGVETSPSWIFLDTMGSEEDSGVGMVKGQLNVLFSFILLYSRQRNQEIQIDSKPIF